jgi:uncharacterized protein
MSRHQIDYESLAQDAMRGLVRTVMLRVAKNGLPGDHHFYISFHTRGDGVTVSKRLLERYPDEMTIVLQNKFSDLKAFDDRFEVTLWFDSIPERLFIPYTAIKVFFDPSVPFGHQFEAAEAQAVASAQAPAARGQADRRGEDRPTPVTSMTSSPSPRSRQTGQGGKPETVKSVSSSVGKGPATVPAKPVSPVSVPATGKVASPKSPSPTDGDRKPAAKTADAQPQAQSGKAAPQPSMPSDEPAPETPSKVVALDTFRKKS